MTYMVAQQHPCMVAAGLLSLEAASGAACTGHCTTPTTRSPLETSKTSPHSQQSYHHPVETPVLSLNNSRPHPLPWPNFTPPPRAPPSTPPPPHLYAGWPPLNEVGCLALAYACESLVHLAGVHLALDDVEDADVAAGRQVLGTSMRRHLRHWARNRLEAYDGNCKKRMLFGLRRQQQQQ
jgi:hypothetical protein